MAALRRHFLSLTSPGAVEDHVGYAHRGRWGTRDDRSQRRTGEDREAPGVKSRAPDLILNSESSFPALQQEAAGHTRGTDSLESRCDHAI